MNVIVRDVMTTHVSAVPRTATFKEMTTQLRKRRVSAFPVVDSDGKVIGVVSEADMLAQEALDFTGPGKVGGLLRHQGMDKAAGITAEDLMTRPPVTVGACEFVSDAARLMYARRVKRLPVVDDDGRLIGIVSRADVLSVYSRPDADICHDVTEGVLLDAMLTDPVRFTVTVKDGIVTLEGIPESAALGRDIVEEVRHVEGVVAVRDRLSYPRAVREAPAFAPLS
jgi:CBS domain-containing protein